MYKICLYWVLFITSRYKIADHYKTSYIHQKYTYSTVCQIDQINLQKPNKIWTKPLRKTFLTSPWTVIQNKIKTENQYKVTKVLILSQFKGYFQSVVWNIKIKQKNLVLNDTEKVWLNNQS